MKKLLVALLVLGLAAPAMAAEVGLYGSFRTHLGYYDVSEEYGYPGTSNSAYSGPDMDQTIMSSGDEDGFDDAGTVLSLSGQSRFGAKAKVTDSLNAIFEVGLKESSRSTYTTTAGSIDQIYLRLAYGVWNFGAGSLTMGKAYTPATYLFYSNQVADLGDMGEAIFLVGGIPYAGRQPQLKLTFGGLDIALIEPNTDVNESLTTLNHASESNEIEVAPGVFLPTGLQTFNDDVDYTFPKIEVAYTFNTPMFSIRPALGYQTYEAVSRGASEDEEDVTSLVAALGVQLRFDPIYVNMMGSYVQNAANYGISNLALGGTGASLMSAKYFDGDVEDSELTTATFVVGAKLGPTVKVEAGISYNHVERDDGIFTETAGLGGLGIPDGLPVTLRDAEQTGFIYYIQAPITVAPGVTITPEVGMIDRGDLEGEAVLAANDIIAADVPLLDLDDDTGKMTYGVVSFRVDF